MQQNIAHYKIEELIGEGSFATVYRAFDEKFERYVALKILSPVWLRDPQAVARFNQEAKTMAKLRHPHIVDVYDIGEAEGRIYLAQFLVEGETLSKKLNGIPLSWTETLVIVDQIAQALDYAHSTGIVHRDIKPSNILMDQEGNAYLGDFGLVRAAEGSVVLSSSAAGGIIGTPAYMSPEQWEAYEVTSATDVYALSCVVVEMLTGKVLFDGPTPAVVMKRHLINGPELPVEWPNYVPPGLNAVLQRGLVEDATQRTQSAGELAQAMTGLSTADEPVVIVTETKEPDSSEVETPSASTLTEAKEESSNEKISSPAEAVTEASVMVAAIDSVSETKKEGLDNALKADPTPTETKEPVQKVESIPDHETANVPELEGKNEKSPGPDYGGKKRSSWVWLGAVILILLLIGGGFYVFTPGATSGGTPTITPKSDESDNASIAGITLTPTPKPLSTNTPTRNPTATPVPTKTPIRKPTATSRPTNTPARKPTATPIPTKTPTRKPTATSRPTNTPTRKPPAATPAPTNTPKPVEPTPTPVPPTPAIPGLIFQDDFSSTENGWFTGSHSYSTGDATWEFVDGKYRESITYKKWGHVGSFSIPNVNVKDFVLTTDVTIVDATDVRDYSTMISIVFRSQGNNEYWAQFSNAGYRLGVYAGSNWSIIKDFVATDVYRIEPGITNSFGVSANGSRIGILANNQELFAIEDQAWNGSGGISFRILGQNPGQRTTVDFDNILVKSP